MSESYRLLADVRNSEKRKLSMSDFRINPKSSSKTCMTQIFFRVIPEIDFFSNTSQDRRFITITEARVSGSSFGPQSEPVWTSNHYIKSLGHSVIHRFLKIIQRLLCFEYQTSWFTRKAQPSFAISVNHFHSICKFHSWLCYFSAFICLFKLPSMY